MADCSSGSDGTVPLEQLPACSITKKHPLSISRVNWEDGVSKKGRKMEERGGVEGGSGGGRKRAREEDGGLE